MKIIIGKLLSRFLIPYLPYILMGVTAIGGVVGVKYYSTKVENEKLKQSIVQFKSNESQYQDALNDYEEILNYLGKDTIRYSKELAEVEKELEKLRKLSEQEVTTIKEAEFTDFKSFLLLHLKAPQ